MVRFLHSSDLHLGKPFGGFPEEVRYRLREARQTVIGRLVEAARAGGAGVIVLTGDSFDAETPAPTTIRHALRAMAAAGDLHWVMMPGNHDSLAATDLWRRIAADAPANLTLALDAAPMALAPGVSLLCAPCTARRPGRDLTEALSAPTPEGELRIGLAHGAVRDFSEDGNAALIPPDRAELSGLDYLGLGDWHGQMQITGRCWYSGTPEADSFKHDRPAGALLVALSGPGAAPEVTTVDTGAIRWRRIELDLLPGDDPGARLSAVLPPVTARRDTLMRLELRGRIGLAGQQELVSAADRAAPDFGWFRLEAGALTPEHSTDDLDRIDQAGALRAAAEALAAEAHDPALSDADRRVAAAALSRLFEFASEGS